MSQRIDSVTTVLRSLIVKQRTNLWQQLSTSLVVDEILFDRKSFCLSFQDLFASGESNAINTQLPRKRHLSELSRNVELMACMCYMFH